MRTSAGALVLSLLQHTTQHVIPIPLGVLDIWGGWTEIWRSKSWAVLISSRRRRFEVQDFSGAIKGDSTNRNHDPQLSSRHCWLLIEVLARFCTMRLQVVGACCALDFKLP